MKLLVITDTHLRGSMIDVQLVSLGALMEWERPDHVLHLGDLGDRGTFGDADQAASTMVRRFVEFVQDWKVPWTILAGNHDYAGTACSLDFFHHELITVVKEPELFDIGNISVLALPWCHGESVKDALKGVDDHVDLLVGHADIHGYVWGGQAIGVDSAFAVRPSWWKHLNCVAEFGHIHHTDKYFLGAVWPKNFGEAAHRGSYGVWEDGYERREMPKHAQIRYREFTADKAVTTAKKKLLGLQYWRVRYAGQRPQLQVPDNVHVAYVKEVVEKRRVSKVATNWDSLDWAGQVAAFMASTDREIHPKALDVILKSDACLTDCDSNPVRLNSIAVKDYGWLHEVKHEFGDFTAIVGKNGTGKSTLLSAVATAAYGAPPDGRLVGELTGNSTALTLAMNGVEYRRQWFGCRYSVDGKAVDEHEWKATLPLPSKNVFFATHYVTQERQNNLLTEDGVQRFRTLAEMTGCVMQPHDPPKQNPASILSQIQIRESELTDAVALAEESEALLKSAQQGVAEEKSRIKAQEKAQKQQQHLEDQIEELESEIDEQQAELNLVGKTHTRLMGEYKRQLDTFVERSKKAGCASNPLPCPLLQKPDAPEQPMLYPIWAETQGEPTTRLKCYRLLEPKAQKWWDKYIGLIGKLRQLEAQRKDVDDDSSSRTLKILQDQLAYRERDLQRAEAAVKTLRQRVAELQAEYDAAVVATDVAWFFGPNGIQKWWLELRLEAIAERANGYLECVETPLSVRFLGGETKNPKVDILVEVDDVERPLRTLSGGQKTLVSLALWAAMGRGFLLLDEPFSWLHSSVVPDACRLLRQASKDRQVIVITHEPVVINYADKVVQM